MSKMKVQVLTAAMVGGIVLGVLGLLELRQYLGWDVFEAWLWVFLKGFAIVSALAVLWITCEIIVVNVMAHRGRK